MTRHRALPLLIAATAALAGCTPLPPIDRTVDAAAKAAPYPDLIATNRLLAGIEEPRIEDTTEAELAARGARLRARGAALRQQ